MIEDLEQVERDLRRLLMPVELVCEADIPQDLIDAAEAGILPLIRSDQYRTVTRLFPATYVTYLVCCGAERYARNRFWPQVGVVGSSSDAGRSFLASLDSLSLPDFETFVEQAGARRYVAPILIHGAPYVRDNQGNKVYQQIESIGTYPPPRDRIRASNRRSTSDNPMVITR